MQRGRVAGGSPSPVMKPSDPRPNSGSGGAPLWGCGRQPRSGFFGSPSLVGDNGPRRCTCPVGVPSSGRPGGGRHSRSVDGPRVAASLLLGGRWWFLRLAFPTLEVEVDVICL